MTSFSCSFTLVESWPKSVLFQALESNWNNDVAIYLLKSQCTTTSTTEVTLNKISTSFERNYKTAVKIKGHKCDLVEKLFVLLSYSESLHTLAYNYSLNLGNLKSFDFILISVMNASNQKPMEPMFERIVKQASEGKLALDAHLYGEVFSNLDIQ